jgi:hypothetical protein
MTRVSFVAAGYQQQPMLVYSLLAQCHRDWELILLHDGPDDQGLGERLAALKDKRIKYQATPSRGGVWGHPLRERGLRQVTGNYVVHTNLDNYYVPQFCQAMLGAMTPELVAVRCRFLTHYTEYQQPCPADLCLGGIDLGCLMYRASVALSLGFPWRRFEADWDLVEAARQAYGDATIGKLDRVLFIHN